MFALFRARSILTFSALTSLLLSACSPATGSTEPAPTLEPQAGLYAFENVNVTPMDREHVLNNQPVFVRDGHIESIQPAGHGLPEGATLIDGSGRYLMPGLAEMHGHVPGGDNSQYVEDALVLYISNGVTLSRGMAGRPFHILRRQRVLER